MTENNTDPKNPEKGAPDPRQISNIYGPRPQSREKFRAAPAKTRKTLSSKARWPGKGAQPTQKHPKIVKKTKNIRQNNTFRLNVKILKHSYEKISISLLYEQE